jgi:hypothetical protein
MTESFQEASIFGEPALFTPVRIDSSTVPDGYHLYELRGSEGDAVHIERSVFCDHWGSLITRDEITLPADGFLDLNPDDLNYNTGNCRSMMDFMSKYPKN